MIINTDCFKNKLNLGCGEDLKKGFINLDYFYKGADVRHDLNVFPYPFKNEYFDYILASHVLEHLEKPIKVIDECFRILKFNGVLDIYVPYYKHHGAYDNPSHIRYFTKQSFDYFVKHDFKKFNDRYDINLYRKKVFCKTYSGRFPFWHFFTYFGIHLGYQIIHVVLIK